MQMMKKEDKLSLASKRNYYKLNSNLYRLKSLLISYTKQLEKNNLIVKKCRNDQKKDDEIEIKLIDMKTVKKQKKK